MFNSVFFFLECLMIIMEKELGESVKENHMGVFLSLCVDCLKESKPQLELQCLNQTRQLSTGQPRNCHQQRETGTFISPLLSGWFYPMGNRPGSHITYTSSWNLTNYKKRTSPLWVLSQPV